MLGERVAWPLAGRPGHAGFTPQPVTGPWFGARALGVISSTPIRAAIRLARPMAPHALPRLQTPEKVNTVQVMADVQRAQQLLSDAQPWPFAFREGFRLASAPEGATE